MTGCGWRTLVTEAHESLSLADECMVIQDGEEKKEVPISQLRTVLITSDRGSISLPLMARLAEENINLIICDGRHNPKCNMSAVNTNGETAGRLMDQSGWTGRKKDAVWKQIVSMKIHMQESLLQKIGRPDSAILHNYRKEIQTGDATNREAVAARVYFRALFGPDFERFCGDSTNAALNYGYTILCSAFNRSVSMHGYSTALGIHHCSRQNPYNLSCDLMEPFRPFVDEMVLRNAGRELDRSYKDEFIMLLHGVCRYGGRKITIADAIEAFTLDVCRAMSEHGQKMKEVGFAE